MKDALSAENLSEYAQEIKQHYVETVAFMAEKQIKVGHLLLKARKEFKGDKEFGQWRADNTPIGSRQTAHKLMQLAEQHSNGRITAKQVEALPTSTLFELLSAPDSVLATVEDKIDDGEKVTAKVIREEKKAAAQEPQTEIEKANANKAAAQAKKELLSKEPTFDDAKYNDTLQLTLAERISWGRKQHNLKDEHAWVIFGIPPFAEGLPHPDVIEACYNVWMCEIKTDQLQVLDKAYKRLQNIYK
jgi:flagellar biosynthesis GTPase FlhF|tara:strand:- start:6977 stop:7711 length:735 start_codon:yes stop_codon:yes gene_type:complete